jgi:hypothetical protein
VTEQAPDEITIKFWPITFTAKGRIAVRAVSKPIFVLIIALAFCLVALGVSGSKIGSGWLNALSQAYGRMVGPS